MPANDPAVEDVAAAILDGTPFDWSILESGAPDELKELLEEFRLLSTVAAVHRDPPDDGEPSSAPSAGGPGYWGRLRLIEPTGLGSFGEVYRAWDPRLHREVGLKLIPAGPGRTSSEEILREGRLLARVRHPGVVTIYDAQQIGEEVGLFMEFVDGPTLQGRIEDKGPFSADETVALGVQLCDALSAVHHAGVLHRDIKAANVALKTDGRVVLMDFGAGGRINDGLHADVTGTPLYVAPEVLEGGPASVRSDVYSLGVLLHYMVTGTYPVPAASLSELRAAHELRQQGGARDDRAFPGGIPAGLRRVLQRALDPVAERRHPTIEALAGDLHGLQRPSVSGGRRIAIAAAGAALAVLAAGLALRSTAAPPHADQRPDPALNIMPVTTYPGLEIHPSLSPDGTHLAFAWDGEPRKDSDIYVQVIGHGAPVQLTSDPRPEFSPSWSPDGRLIAFCRTALTGDTALLNPGSAGEIIVVPAQGGVERVVARPTDSWVPACGTSPTLSWFPSSDALASVGYSAPRVVGRAAAIYVVPLDGAPSSAITSPAPVTWGDAVPAVSPDGRYLAFTRSSTQYWVSAEAHILALTGDKLPARDPEPLVPVPSADLASAARTHPVVALGWIAGPDEVILSRQGLWVVPPEGRRVPRLVPTPGSRPSAFTVSPDGNRLVFSSGSWVLDIWRIRGPAGRRGEGHPPEGHPFIATTMVDSNPQYSRDGKRVAFTSTRSGTLQIWTADADGSNAVQVTRSVAWNGTPRWSPDGRHLAYDAVEGGKGDIYVIPAGGGAASRVTPEDSHEHVPSWSRDGGWIYFESDRTGEFQIWKTEFPSGATVQVTTQGGAAAFESPDGWLYYGKRWQAGLWRKPVTGGEEEQVTERGHAMFWGMYDQGACWTDPLPDEVSVECLDFESARVETVARFPNGGRLRQTGPSFAVSPDGQWILYSRVEREEADLMLVENFGAMRQR